jgi:hypothetical protein
MERPSYRSGRMSPGRYHTGQTEHRGSRKGRLCRGVDGCGVVAIFHVFDGRARCVGLCYSSHSWERLPGRTQLDTWGNGRDLGMTREAAVDLVQEVPRDVPLVEVVVELVVSALREGKYPGKSGSDG